MKLKICYIYSQVSSPPSWGSSLQVHLRSVHLPVHFDSQVAHALPPVQGHPDLLIGLHKTLEFPVQVSVLVLQNSDVLLQRLDLRPHVRIPVNETGIAEADVLQFPAYLGDLLISVLQLGFQVIQVGTEISALSLR